MDEVAPIEAPLPDTVEMRYPSTGVAQRVTLSLLLAIGATILIAAFMQVPLMQAAARIGQTALFTVWLLFAALFAGWVWWQSVSFVLRADGNGIHRAAGMERTTIKWTDIATAEAIEPANTAGPEAMTGLYIVLRSTSGEKLISLGFDIRRGLQPDQVSEFKRYVRAQLEAHPIAKEGPPQAWANWC